MRERREHGDGWMEPWPPRPEACEPGDSPALPELHRRSGGSATQRALPVLRMKANRARRWGCRDVPVALLDRADGARVLAALGLERGVQTGEQI